MFEKITNSVDDMQDNIQNYINSSIEYYKLDIFKKLTKSVISVTRVFALGGIAFLLFSFLSFGFAFLIGEALGNFSYGFFVMAGFYLIVFIVVALFLRKPLEKKILKTGSRIFFND